MCKQYFILIILILDASINANICYGPSHLNDISANIEFMSLAIKVENSLPILSYSRICRTDFMMVLLHTHLSCNCFVMTHCMNCFRRKDIRSVFQSTINSLNVMVMLFAHLKIPILAINRIEFNVIEMKFFNFYNRTHLKLAHLLFFSYSNWILFNYRLKIDSWWTQILQWNWYHLLKWQFFTQMYGISIFSTDKCVLSIRTFYFDWINHEMVQ